MFKKTHYVAFGSVLLLAVVALNLPGGFSARLKHAVGGLFLPLFGLANSGEQLARKTADNLIPRAELQRQNAEFSRENSELKLRLNQADQIQFENARLRQLLGWQKQTAWKLKLANVVLRDPENWWATVQIDLGSRDGLRENLPVLTADGFLVGRVSSVGVTSSQVVLVGDPACKVSALVQNDARDNGVVTTRAGTLDSSLVTLAYLPRSAVVTPGQRVVTSGLGKVFPAGISVGQVVSAHSVEFGLYIEAQVKLAANLGGLEQVWILFP